MACSKRHWAYAFLGLGVVFLILGFICGFLIPKIVVRMVESKACVDSADDSDYKDWVKKKDGPITKLYFWNITNKDGFLYKGEMPNLKEIGPYVYKQEQQKVDVSFEGDRVTYKSWTMDPEFSKEDSCSTCSEKDKVTVINMGYIALMDRIGGDTNFALSVLKVTISVIMKNFNNSYARLGNISEIVWDGEGPPGWSRPGFGAWLHQINATLASNGFNETEMKGLYNVLINEDALFGLTQKNPTVNASCKVNPVNKTCGFLTHLKALQNRSLKLNISELINTTLCPNVTTSCFGHGKPDLIPMIFPYILHVSKYTLWFFLHQQDDIVTTISQEKIARGYDMIKVLNPVTKKPINIPALVISYANETQARTVAKNESFYTCKASKDIQHQWAAYDGQKTISSAYYDDLLDDDKYVQGYFMVVPHSKSADKPCSFSQEVPMSSFDVFVSVIRSTFRTSYKEDTSLHDLNVKRHVLSKEDYLGHSAVKDGLMDYSKIYNSLLIGSLPHFLYSDNLTIPEPFNQDSNVEKHESIYDVEPVTGAVVRAEIRLQFNVPIKKEFVSIPRFNISYTADKPEELLLKTIPVLWGTFGGQAKKSDTDTLKKKVLGLLGLSCGLLIALPIIGGIFVVVAVALLVFSAKANAITHITHLWNYIPFQRWYFKSLLEVIILVAMITLVNMVTHVAVLTLPGSLFSQYS